MHETGTTIPGREVADPEPMPRTIIEPEPILCFENAIQAPHECARLLVAECAPTSTAASKLSRVSGHFLRAPTGSRARSSNIEEGPRGHRTVFDQLIIMKACLLPSNPSRSSSALLPRKRSDRSPTCSPCKSGTGTNHPPGPNRMAPKHSARLGSTYAFTTATPSGEAQPRRPSSSQSQRNVGATPRPRRRSASEASHRSKARCGAPPMHRNSGGTHAASFGRLSLPW